MRTKVLVFLVGTAIAGAIACSSDSSDDSPGPGTGTGTGIGPAGGVVAIDGVTLTVPEGALDKETAIAIAKEGSSPAGYEARSPVYRFTPDGLEFKKPATVEISYTSGAAQVVVQWSRGSGNEYEALTTDSSSGRAKASVTHFSNGFVASASGGVDGGGSDGGGGTVSAQGIAGIAQAYCDKLFTCLPVDAKPLWADVAACKARIEAKLSLVVKASGVTLDDAGATACATTYSTGTCTGLRDLGLGVSPIEPLKPCKVKGSLAIGTACGTGAQCVSGFCNGFEGNCGKCTALIAENAQCGGGTECERGLRCSNTCVKPATENQACGGANPPCTGELECINSICTKHVDPSGACIGAENNPTCSDKLGYYCLLDDGGTNGTCTALPFASATASCAYPTKCANSACVGNTCTAYIADGQTCPTGEGPNLCQAPGRCLSGTCGLFDPTTCK